MKNKFEVKGKEYLVPTNWGEVSVRTFESVLELALNEDAYQTKLEYGLRVTSVLTEIPYEDLLKLSNGKFKELQDMLSWSNIDVSHNGKKEYIIKGSKYLPIVNYDSLTVGEAIDAELIIKDSPSHKLLSNLLPLLIRRAVSQGRKVVPGEFDGKNYKSNVELLKDNLSITDVIHLKGFF